MKNMETFTAAAAAMEVAAGQVKQSAGVIPAALGAYGIGRWHQGRNDKRKALDMQKQMADYFANMDWKKRLQAGAALMFQPQTIGNKIRDYPMFGPRK